MNRIMRGVNEFHKRERERERTKKTREQGHDQKCHPIEVRESR